MTVLPLAPYNVLRTVRGLFTATLRTLTAPFISALIPLPDKVFNLMWECNCAIINVSADTEKKQGDVFGINENVIAELWGAFLHYKKRVILVIDSRLKDKLPSMMQGLTAIFYEGDKLAWDDGIRLQKALDEFRNQL
jgi:hypothetical protein